MTFFEKIKQEQPEVASHLKGCPKDFGYETDKYCFKTGILNCHSCWNREIPEERTIKPCPFCGNSKPRLMRDEHSKEVYVICDGTKGCHAHSAIFSPNFSDIRDVVFAEGKAIECWNRRDFKETKISVVGRAEPLVVAVDFDGTLFEKTDNYPKCGNPIERVHDLIRAYKTQGAVIILWTCREGADLAEALKACLHYNLPIDYVNENTPFMIEKFGNDCRKIGADIYIDDKAVKADKAKEIL